MELLNIDFNLTINDISKYHDEWCKERFGDSDNAKFFEQSPDGRYIYPCVKTGEKLAEEYAIRNRFLELLLRIKKANDKLNNVGQTWPLEYGEREAIKKERQELYSELLQIDKRARGDYSNNNKPTKAKVYTTTEREDYYFDKAINAGLMRKDGVGYKWLYNNGSKASLAYFLQKVFNPDGTQTTPFKKLETLFNVSRLAAATYKLLCCKNMQKRKGGIDKLFEK